MNAQISFCPMCAGKLEAGDEDQFICEECESAFLIEVVVEGDEDDEEEEEEEEL
jgi:uncharacterized protein YbaR (Trm112 family)